MCVYIYICEFYNARLVVTQLLQTNAFGVNMKFGKKWKKLSRQREKIRYLSFIFENLLFASH